MKKPSRLCILRRPRLRQSWNKYNVFNFVQLENPLAGLRYRNHFMQKFMAKSHLRAYHGEHITEKKWKQLFSRRIYSAIDMPSKYLAMHDGSEQATGRGSGRDFQETKPPVSASKFSYFASGSRKLQLPDWDTVRAAGHLKRSRIDGVTVTMTKPILNMTPYMQNLFWPLERRLDTAIFRALFASSVRQARQFVVHGAVRVNGLKVRHPGYMLNPGDMFQVDIEKVMLGTGCPKTKDSVINESSLENADGMAKEKLGFSSEEEEDIESHKSTSESSPHDSDPEPSATSPFQNGTASEVLASDKKMNEEELKKHQHQQLRSLILSAKELLKHKDKHNLSVKDKQELRAFRTTAQRVLSKLGTSGISGDEVAKLSTVISRFEISDQGLQRVDDKLPTQKDVDLKTAEGKTEDPLLNERLSDDERARLTELLQLNLEEENPVDSSKPYLTPWRPRPFMQMFAFIPRYLEVNQNICAAVYLRHPLVRVGMAEVPTPFDYQTSQMGHSWYIRPVRF